ncbi:hypothetical protein JOF53_000010 [Crossiella equi]|uniref:Uncharacterized protein n=1 Tax=Crossiella equi TaxID=130796 RepID=A0ABS5A3I0_9PSEU|nr:hypothetical protein [Crossiella equi]MBP2471138.1 hypothetical protein [Crossiella equi]
MAPSTSPARLTETALRRGHSGTAVLPGQCRLGLHPLRIEHFRAVASSGSIKVDCPACAQAGANTQARTWRLTFTGPTPRQAEVRPGAYDVAT